MQLFGFETPPKEQVDQVGEGSVAVYGTDRSDVEDMYLHIVEYPEENGERTKGYVVAPGEYRL